MTAAKDHKNKPLSLRTASLDQLWSCLQRCLLFEEPSSRWERLIAQVSRHASGKPRDLQQLTLSEQQVYFKAVFGTPDDLLDPSSRALNLVLAMQDLRRFEAAEYDIWLLSGNGDSSPALCERVFFDIAGEVLGEEATQTQAESLQQAWNIVPYWRVLESFGPWADDALADFVASLLSRFSRLPLELTAKQALTAESEFLNLLKSSRLRLPSNFLPDILVLVEGATESILLPRFLSITSNSKARKDSSSAGQTEPVAMFIACGGANQLLRKYLHLRDTVSLPLMCVIDHDASEHIATIKDVLRDRDRLHVWSVGEIEDTFEQDSLLHNLNAYLQLIGVSELILPHDLPGGSRRTETLDRLWRSRGLGDFNKVGFAEFQVSQLKQSRDIPDEGKELMETIRQMPLSIK